MKRILRLTLFALLAQGCVLASRGQDVPVYGIFEQSFTQSGSYENPYTEVTATAMFIEPDGRRRSIPLFWDGGNTWKVRFSPDTLGSWSWAVSSSDSGLNKQTGSFNSVRSSNLEESCQWRDIRITFSIKTAPLIGYSGTRNGNLSPMTRLRI